MTNLPSQIRDLNLIGSTTSYIDLILVPGIGTPPVEQWALCSKSWLEHLMSLDTHTRLLAFDHSIAIDTDFEWQRVLDEGANLLAALIDLTFQDGSDLPPRPIIMVCHSLGGLIVKQALSIANLRAVQNHKYRHFINCVAAIVYISTPHNPELLSDCALTVLKHFADVKLPKQHVLQLRDDAARLVDIVERYQHVNLGIDILTLYERLPTKSRRGWRSKSVLVVNHQLAEIKGAHEVCVALLADHSSICDLGQTEQRFHPEVQQWLTTVIENAVHNIKERLKAYAIRNPPSAATSIYTDISSVPAALTSDDKPDTVRADSSASTFEHNMNTIFENFSAAKSEANLPCFVVSTFTQNEDFFGRDDILGRLDNALLPGTNLIASSEPGRMNHVILCGMAGMGKTEIAVHYVYTRRSQFDAIFWIRAEDGEKLVADFGQLTHSLGLLDPNEPDNPVVSRDIAKGWLTNPKRLLGEEDNAAGQAPATWLLVFDNADNPDLLQDYLPIFGKGSILITSREPDGKNFQGSEPVVIHVKPFNDSESTEFLAQLTRSHNQQKQCNEIAGLLGGLPLAIAQMAGVMRKQYLDYAEFLEMYEDISERAEIHESDLGMTRQTARGTVSSIWAIDTLSDAARTLLELFAFMDPERIQEYVVVNKDTEMIDYDLSKVPTTRAKFLRARGELLHQSLIRRNEEKKEIWVHRVLQDVVKAQLVKQGQDALESAFSHALALVESAWPIPPAEKRHSVERWPVCEALCPHVVALNGFFERHLSERSSNGKLRLTLISLLHETGWWQYERGNFGSARTMGERARTLCTRLDLSTNKHIISRNHDLLGCIANGTNNAISSLDHNTELLALRKEIVKESGKQDVLLAYAHNQFGCSLMMAGRYEEATSLFHVALDIWKCLPEFKPGLPSMEYSNLGLAYWMQGKHDEALEVLEKGLREREEGFGYMDNESFRAGRILYALGNVHASLGHVQDSEQFHQRALLQFQSTVGNTYHRTADICHKLAHHCYRRADTRSLDKGRKLVDQALTTWQADTKAFCNEIARTTFLKSRILERLGEADEAAELKEQAVVKRSSILRLTVDHTTELTLNDFDELVTFWSR